MEAVEIKTEPLDDDFNQIVQEEIIIKAEDDIAFTTSDDFVEVAESEIQIEEEWLSVKEEPVEEPDESLVENESLSDQITNTPPNQNQCIYCSTIFKSLTTLKLHERLHCVKKNDCRLCGQKFVTTYALKIHMEKMHSDNINKEEISPRNDKSRAPMGRPRNISSVNPDPRCDVCNLTFANSRDLNNHKKKHNTCQQCGEYFKVHEDLKRHNCENVEIKMEDESEPESPTKQIFKATNSIVVIPRVEIPVGKPKANVVAKNAVSRKRKSQVLAEQNLNGCSDNEKTGIAPSPKRNFSVVTKDTDFEAFAQLMMKGFTDISESSEKHEEVESMSDKILRKLQSASNSGNEDSQPMEVEEGSMSDNILRKRPSASNSGSEHSQRQSMDVKEEAISDEVLIKLQSASNSGNEDSQPCNLMINSTNPELAKRAEPPETHDIIVDSEGNTYKILKENFVCPSASIKEEPTEIKSANQVLNTLKEDFVCQSEFIKEEEPSEEESDNELTAPEMPSPLPSIKDEPEERNQEESNATDFADSLLEELFDRKAKSIAKERQAKFGYTPSFGQNGLGFEAQKEFICLKKNGTSKQDLSVANTKAGHTVSTNNNNTAFSPKDFDDLKNGTLTKRNLLIPSNIKRRSVLTNPISAFPPKDCDFKNWTSSEQNVSLPNTETPQTALTNNNSAFIPKDNNLKNGTSNENLLLPNKTKRQTVVTKKLPCQASDQKLPTKPLPTKNNFLYQLMKKEGMLKKLPTVKDANSDEVFLTQNTLILTQLKEAFQMAKKAAPQPKPIPLPIPLPQPPHPTQIIENQTKKQNQLPVAYKTYDQMIAMQFLELANKPGCDQNEEPIPALIISPAHGVPSLDKDKGEDITPTTERIAFKPEISIAEEIISTPDFNTTPYNINSSEDHRAIIPAEEVTNTSSTADDTSQPSTTTQPFDLAQNNNFDFEQMIESSTLPNFQKINMVIKSLTEDYQKAEKVKLEDKTVISKETIEPPQPALLPQPTQPTQPTQPIQPTQQSTDVVKEPNRPGSLFFPILEDIKIYKLVARALNDKYRYAWICPLCPRQYYQVRAFRTHLLTIHYKTKGEYSGKTFELRPELITEAEGTSDENFCYLCHVELADKFTLKKHQLEIHKGHDVKPKKYVRIHKCYICTKTFPSRSSLVSHMKSDCGNNPQYGCNICEKKFHTKSTLTLHKTMHTGELPHSCVFCQKRFRTRGQLTVHTRTHTGEKPFPCKVCGQRFTHRETLIAHLSRHIDMKRYKCYGCDSFFSCISGLKTHRLTRPVTCGLVELDARAVGPRVRVIKGNVLFEPQPIFNARLTKSDKDIKYPPSRVVFLDHSYCIRETKLNKKTSREANQGELEPEPEPETNPEPATITETE